MTPVIVLTTTGPGFDAHALARTLVEAKLAACVNIVPRVDSIYQWDGRVVEDIEQLLIIKTTDARVDALRERLFALHSYEVPEFVVLPIAGTSEAYGAWLIGTMNEEG